VSQAVTCSGASLAAAEPLRGTATQGVSWLLVEVRGSWGRDAVLDTTMPAAVRATLEEFSGKVVLVRRPDRRHGATLIRATVDEEGGTLSRQELDALDRLPDADLEAGDPAEGPIFLVCTHGRRDACCARLGMPVFDALAQHVGSERLWQSSHLGGHRFAPNLLVLPHGIQLGRIPRERAAAVVQELARGRIPLDLYRGRTLYAPPVQAAEIAVRGSTGCDGVADLRLVAHDENSVTFATPVGVRVARVEERPGPVGPVSCGAEPEPTSIWLASLVG
jgi:hypothetical protein